ncbi:MAG: hypothetical protein JWO45_1616 [Spartobacteria bacterium]|nr:hypothetical protein [Spartobacteria bacterium]
MRRHWRLAGDYFQLRDRFEQRLMMGKEQWHLDKKVPITLIGAMLIQVMAFVGWASAYILGVALGLFNHSLAAADQSQLVDVLSSIGSGVGAIIAIYGRVTANKTVQ